MRKRLLKGALSVVSRTGMSQRVMASRDSVPKRLVQAAKDGRPMEYPRDIQFEITMKCNLDCVMCHQKSRREKVKRELSVGDIRKIIDNFSTGGVERVKLIGGEIFVRKDILEIISYLQEKNIGVSITTNGTLINEALANELKRFGNILGMVFSIDGMEAVHNMIRGKSDTFKKAIDSLKRVSAFIPTTKITCVLQKSNIDDIEEIMLNCRSWGVDVVSFMTEAFFSEEDIARTGKALGCLGEVKFFVTPSERQDYDFSLDELHAAIRKIKSMARKSSVIGYLSPPAAALNPDEFYAGEILRGGREMTCGYLNKLVITESGDVLGCPFIDLRFGNMLQQPLGEIWNSTGFIEYRRLLAAGGLFPICKRCCVLTCIS